MDSERVLPKESRLDTWVRDFADEIRDELEAISEHQDNSDIILQSFMESDSTNANNFRAAAKFLHAEVFQEGEKAQETIVRAVFFANQVAGFIYSEDLGYRIEDYLQELFENDDPRHRLELDVRGSYLVENPAVRDFLRTYARAIDQYRGHENLVETVGGMVCMLVERSLGEQFIHSGLYELPSNDESTFELEG
jgi:hypothetical protein